MSRPILERSLPQSLEAERAVLGAILVNNENYYSVVETLAPEHFYSDQHRKIFTRMIDMVQESTVIDLVTLQDRLLRENELESAGGIVYITGLMDGVPHLINVVQYVVIIKGKHLLRQLIGMTNRTMSECFEAAEEPERILEAAERGIMDLAQSRIATGFTAVADMRAETARLLQMLYVNRQIVTGVATGFVDIDRLTGGLQPSDLIILAARPSMGKTALALNLAQQAALRGSVNVGIFSLEMSKEQLMLRMLCSESRVDSMRLRSGYLSQDDMQRLTAELDRICQSHIFIDDSSSISIIEMRSKCTRLHREHGVGLIIIDYLQLMSGGAGSKENRTQEISSISRGLKGIARDLNIPVVALSQLSRATEQRSGDHKPILSDLRESGSIEQDADVVAFIYRAEVYDPSDENAGRAEIIFAKQRNGPTGVVQLAYLRQFNRFESLLDMESIHDQR